MLPAGSGAIPRAPGSYEYFAQAVDPAGYVAMAMDHDNPYAVELPLIEQPPPAIFLPLIRN